MAIEVHGVNKSFGTTPVLREVSVDIASGSLTALLGPSGGGKSTLLRVIAGLEQPDTGTVVISGVDATRLSPQRRNVGFVFQHYAAFKHMTVYGNVAFGSPRCCCSTSRSGRWTRRCARSCVPGCAGYTTRCT